MESEPEAGEPKSVLACPGDMAPPPHPFPRLGFSGSPSSPGSSPGGSKLNFPVPGPQFDLRRQSITASPLSSRSGSPSREPQKPDEPTQFLTALAASERRVLELREELKKAESDLVQLKHEWTTREAARKRDEATFQPMQLRPMTSPNRDTLASGNSKESSEQSTSSRQQTPGGRAKSPQRRFEGGKHTRTLSLLTPVTITNHDYFEATPVIATDGVQESMATLHRSNQDIDDNSKHQKLPRRPDELVNTGRQLVGDLRDGLWTFIEDLRQVTVGDEASPARNRPRSVAQKKGASTSKRDSAITVPDHNDSQQSKGDPKKLARDPLKPSSGNPQRAPEAMKASITAGGSSRDSELAFHKDANTVANASAVDDTVGAVSIEPCKEASSRDTGDKIAWPSLGSLSPSRLSKTASSLMQEWEKSFTDPAEPTPSN